MLELRAGADRLVTDPAMYVVQYVGSAENIMCRPKPQASHPGSRSSEDIFRTLSTNAERADADLSSLGTMIDLS
jgi:hypothetical protein